MSFLYAVQMLIPDYVQPVKIGFSRTPAIRVQSYNSEPFPMRLLGCWPVADQSQEKLLHGRFDNYRMCGEWFYPAPVLLAFIRTELTKSGVAFPGQNLTHAQRSDTIRNAQRWNLARLAADDGKQLWGEWDQNTEHISSVFDRSEVSHAALKSAWRL